MQEEITQAHLHPPLRLSIKAVVFDLDGVLIHSTRFHRLAFEQVLAPLGTTDFCYEHYAGWRTPEVIAAELQRAALPADPATITRLAEEKSRIARELIAASNPVAENCVAVLSELASRSSLGLASSGSRASVQAFLDRSGSASLFRSVLTGDDVAHAKPDPEIYRTSFTRLGLPPQTCMVIEDAVAGIEAARRAGAPAIGMTGTCSHETLLAAGALDTLDGLSGLPELLASL